MCVMIYLKRDVIHDEFVVADSMASADYIGMMNSFDGALEIMDINDLLSKMEIPNSIEQSTLVADSVEPPQKEKPHTLDYLHSMGIENVISSSFTLSALRLFKRYGFNTYKAINSQLEDNLACYFNSELKPYDYYRDTTHRGCGS